MLSREGNRPRCQEPRNSHMWMRDNTRHLGVRCHDCGVRRCAPLAYNEAWMYDIYWPEHPDYDHIKDD